MPAEGPIQASRVHHSCFKIFLLQNQLKYVYNMLKNNRNIMVPFCFRMAVQALCAPVHLSGSLMPCDALRHGSIDGKQSAFAGPGSELGNTGPRMTCPSLSKSPEQIPGRWQMFFFISEAAASTAAASTAAPPSPPVSVRATCWMGAH